MLGVHWGVPSALALGLTTSLLLQSRPFGVALLFGGVDEKGPQL